MQLKIVNSLEKYDEALNNFVDGNSSFNVYEKWTIFQNKTSVKMKEMFGDKIMRLNKKFSALTGAVTPCSTMQQVEFTSDFVVNESSQSFTNKELHLLNRGLPFVPSNGVPSLKNVIIDIEAVISFEPFSQQMAVRSEVDRVLHKTKESLNYEVSGTTSLIENLREKPVHYVKADKGNKIVILDKDDYESRMLLELENGPYEVIGEVDDWYEIDLGDVVKKMEKVIKECKDVFQAKPTDLRVNNPRLSRIYGLPKIHKQRPARKKLRLINSNISFPTENLRHPTYNEALENIQTPISVD